MRIVDFDGDLCPCDGSLIDVPNVVVTRFNRSNPWIRTFSLHVPETRMVTPRVMPMLDNMASSALMLPFLLQSTLKADEVSMCLGTVFAGRGASRVLIIPWLNAVGDVSWRNNRTSPAQTANLLNLNEQLNRSGCDIHS